MNFEELCNLKSISPQQTIVEFLKYNPKIFRDILKEKDNEIYRKILEILLEKEEKNLEEFIDWFRDFLYNY